MVLDGLEQNQQAGLDHQGVLGFPLLIVEEIVFKTAEANTVVTEDVPGFETIAQQPIDQQFIAIGDELFGARSPVVYRYRFWRTGMKLVGVLSGASWPSDRPC